MTHMTDDRSVRVAGNWIQSYLKCAEGQESPTLFHLWVAITVIASTLRRNVFLDMNFFKIYPNFYTILVSPSGTCRKGIAIGIGERFLAHVDGLNIFRTKLTPEALLTFLKEEAKVVNENEKENEKEEETSYKSEVVETGEEDEGEAESDAESAADVDSTDEEKETYKDTETKISQKYTEVTTGLIIAPELSTMLGSASYADDLKIMLTDLFDNKEKDGYTTKKGGRIELYNVNINMLGGSNPTWLARSFSEDSFGGGFMGRTIFVYQSEGSKVPWPEKSAEIKVLEKLLIMDLQRISRIRGNFYVTPEARDFYADWYMKFKPDTGTRMSGYYERKHIHLLKVAMVLAIAEGDRRVIDVKHCKAALVLLEQLEAWMPDAFAYIGATLEARVEQEVLNFLRSNDGYAKASVLLRHVRKSVRGKREFDAIMNTLSAGGTVVQKVQDKVLYYVFTTEYLARKKEREERERERERKEKERKANRG